MKIASLLGNWIFPIYLLVLVNKLKYKLGIIVNDCELKRLSELDLLYQCNSFRSLLVLGFSIQTPFSPMER